jgi:EAL domain-containing protein (putative c-di-GMP-specific phosphodiesterase class I)
MARAYGVNLLGAIEKPPTPKKLKAAIDLHAVARPRRSAQAASIITVEEITRALQNDEFEPFFQAKVRLDTGRIQGAEALARWRHPLKGILLPQAFIEPIEDAGLMEEFTEMILKKAATCCRIWDHAGLDASVSVNLSLGSLGDVTLADRMMQIAYRQGLEPRHVIFEVTESAAATDLARSLENLTRLRMHGFGLAIDDYGTGYSSMQQLTRIAFTELKIDQSFVKNAATQASSRAMLESSLEMAAKLKIVAVAEGVETRAEWELLRNLGCQLGQGYFIAKPMDAGEFLDWVRVRRSA